MVVGPKSCQTHGGRRYSQVPRSLSVRFSPYILRGSLGRGRVGISTRYGGDAVDFALLPSTEAIGSLHKRLRGLPMGVSLQQKLIAQLTFLLTPPRFPESQILRFVPFNGL